MKTLICFFSLLVLLVIGKPINHSQIVHTPTPHIAPPDTLLKAIKRLENSSRNRLNYTK